MTETVVYQMRRQDKIDALALAVEGLGEVPAFYRPWLVDWRDAADVPGWRWSRCKTEADAIDLVRVHTYHYQSSPDAARSLRYLDIAHPRWSTCTALLWACAGPQACDYVGGHPELLFDAVEGWSTLLSINYVKYTNRLLERQRGRVGLGADLDSFSWGVYGPAVHAMAGARMLFRWLRTTPGKMWLLSPDAGSVTLRVAASLTVVLRPMLALWAYLSVPASGGGRAVLMGSFATEQVSEHAWYASVPRLRQMGFDVRLHGDIPIAINYSEGHQGPSVVIPNCYTEQVEWVIYTMATFHLMRALEPWLTGIKTGDQTTVDDQWHPDIVSLLE